MNYHILRADEPLAKMFTPGTILWRPVNVDRFYGAKVDDRSQFVKTDQGSFMGRLDMHTRFEPTLHGNEYEDFGRIRKIRGMAVFMEKEPEPLWTHMTVTKVSKAMREPWNGGKGCAIFVEPAKPYDLIDYLVFWSKLAQYQFGLIKEYNSLIRLDFEKVIKYHLETWPEGYRPGDRRLLLKVRSLTEAELSKHPEPLYDYCHLVIPKVVANV